MNTGAGAIIVKTLKQSASPEYPCMDVEEIDGLDDAVGVYEYYEDSSTPLRPLVLAARAYLKLMKGIE